MKIYHGTSEIVGRKAIKEGLKPRIATGNSNWGHTVESNASMVYLTSTYAPYFAFQSTGEHDKKFSIIEVETDLLNQNYLFPDEDFIEQASRNQKDIIKGNTMKERTIWVRKNINLFQRYWRDSLDGLGNCSYKGIIGLKAITRISIIDFEKEINMLLQAMQPSITIMNYKICSNKYKLITKWFMGANVNVDEWMNTELTNSFLNDEQLIKFKDNWGRILNNQSGIEIIYKKS